MIKIARIAPLSLAIAGALGVAPAANAITIEYANGVTPVYAQEALNAASDVAILLDELNFEVTATSGYIGRTDGFNVNMTVPEGTFMGFVNGVTCNMLLGSALGTTPINTATEWVCSVAAGAGTNSVTLSISNTGGEGVSGGNLLSIDAGLIGLKGIDGLVPNGVTMDFVMKDATTTVVIDEATDFQLGTTGPGVAFSSDIINANTAYRIDVGAAPPRTWFSQDGTISGDPVNTANTTLLFNAGDVGVDIARFNDGADKVGCAGPYTISQGIFGRTPAHCVDNLGAFKFDTGNDTVTITVKGSDFGAFMDDGDGATTEGIYIDAAANDCATRDPELEMTVTQDQATLSGIDLANDAENTYTVCFMAPGGDVEIQPQLLSAVASVQFSGSNVDDTEDSAELPLAPLRTNGSTVELFTVNPGSNPVAEGFVRFCHYGTSAGLVTLEAWDKNGAEAPGGDVTFNLAPQECFATETINLEQGNPDIGLTGAWGDGAGKWIVRATGQFAGLRAAAYIRNTSNGNIFDTSGSSLDRSELPEWAEGL